MTRAPYILPSAAAATLLVACMPPPEPLRDPMGRLPNVVTTAEPEWIPLAVVGGQLLPSDARERRLGEPRRIEVGGAATRVAWTPDGRTLLVELRRDGSSCESVVAVDLARPGSPRAVSGDGTRGRLGAALPSGRALIAEAPCSDAPDKAAWTVVDVDPTANLRRVVARAEGEVVGVTTDGRSAFFATRDGRGKGRVEGAPLDGGAARALIDGTAAWGSVAAAPARAVLVVVRETKDGGAQLVVASDQGGDARPWSRGAARDADPAALPDGSAIVFASSRAAAGKALRADDPSQIYLAPSTSGEADGGPAPERVTFAGEDNRAPAVGPRGRDLAWISDRAAPGGPRSVIVARFDGAP